MISSLLPSTTCTPEKPIRARVPQVAQMKYQQQWFQSQRPHPWHSGSVVNRCHVLCWCWQQLAGVQHAAQSSASSCFTGAACLWFNVLGTQCEQFGAQRRGVKLDLSQQQHTPSSFGLACVLCQSNPAHQDEGPCPLRVVTAQASSHLLLLRTASSLLVWLGGHVSCG